MNKSKSNKLIIVTIVTIVVLVVALVILNFVGTKPLYVIGNSEMEAILNDESGVGTFVYIGRPTCPACLEFQPILERTLNGLDQDLPYYEVELARLEDQERVSEIFEILDISGVPAIVYVVNGNVEDSITGVNQQEAILEFFETNGGL